jgi:ATP-dependent Clp endopeptidase proteolytic subunit ClpP
VSRKWYQIENAGSSDSPAVIRIFDGVGGWFGVYASEFARDLDAITANAIDLHVNSPGGDAFEGLAIMNSLRKHPATVTAYVDGMAASIASVIVAGGADKVVMGLGAEIMIHNPAANVGGSDARDLREIADRLDQMRDNLASIYMHKAGGDLEFWRAAMDAETWYTAQEAVDVGLADAIAVESPVPESVKARFDLSIFNYAGRAHAPAPKHPAVSASGSTEKPEGSPAVAFSDEQLTSMRQQLGIATDADEATILAALGEALSERAEAPAAPSATPQASASPAPAPTPVAAAPGTMVIDASAWQAQQDRIERLVAADNRRRRDERDTVIATAVKDGKFPKARSEHWERLWDADPDGTREVINGLAKGVVPMNELGHAGDDSDFDEFSHIFPKEA